MAGIKRKYDDALTADAFFTKIGVIVPDTVSVPDGCTVRDIREIVLHADKTKDCGEWMGNFPYGNWKEIEKSIKDHSSYEDILHCARIVCTPGGDKELKIQRRLSDENKLITCRTDAKNSGSDGNGTDTREGDSISLVLGPSGSGKTTFCANESIKSATKGKEFRVYMYSNDLCAENHHEDTKENFRIVLEKQIRNALDLSTDDPLDRLDMTLYAIIDEAGSDDYFANKNNIHDLRKVVSEFASDGQLVLSGTGLDLLTTDIGSTGEGIKKIRMMPWNIADFVELAKNNDMAVQLVKKHFVYGAMVSNARAAACLLERLVITEKWGEPDENVPHVLRGVAYGYIQGNGLKDLNGLSRRRVAQAVIKVLDSCKYDCTNIPDFEKDRKLLSEDEMLKAKSLIDVHVKKTVTGIELHDGHHYAVSVTPAITLVLATLLGSSASLVHEWAGFEAVVALNELFKLVREAESEAVPKCKIVQLDRPYDAREKFTTLSVPVMDPFTVLVNGKMAAFADVIARYRLIQAKHSKHSNGTVLLNIKDELMKMGLLKCSPFVKKVFVRSLYEIWNTYTKSDCPVTSATQQEQATEHGGEEALEGSQHRSLYPASLLISERIKKKPVCWELKEHGKDKPKWSRSDFKHSPKMTDEDWNDNWVKTEKPLTVAFVTNGQKFKLKSTNKKDKDCVLTNKGGNTYELREREDLSEWIEKLLVDELIKGVHVEIVFARA